MPITSQTPSPTDMEINIPDIVTGFHARQATYSGRNVLLSIRDNLFEGRHWRTGEEQVGDTEYQLVINYIRNVVLRFTAIMSRHPTPRVPLYGSIEEQEVQNRKEQFLHSLWPELTRAWSDVEMNSSKLSYGVLQCIWAPEPDQPEQVKMGKGEDARTETMYTESPFKFRSIPPERFFPVFRTYDHANDFLEVYRWDPGRLVKDLEKTYGVELQSTGMSEHGDMIIGTEETCDVVEYWTKEIYLLLALTRKVVDRRGKKAGSRPPRPGDIDITTQYHVLEAGKNPYAPTIPFWILQNIRSNPNKDPTTEGSMADIDDIAGLNLHMEEILSEEAEEIVINIHRPLIYKSREHQQDPSAVAFKPGAMIPIGDEEDLETLQWQGEPSTVPNHIERIDTAIKDLSFLGDAGFGQLAAGMSGVSFKIALTPLQQITELKLPLRQDVLRSVCKFLLKCFEDKASQDSAFMGFVKTQAGTTEMVTLSPEEVAGRYHVEIDYGPLLPRDDAAFVQNEVYKHKSGTQSLVTTLDKLGVRNPRQEIERIKEEAQDPVLNPEMAIAIQQAKQATQQPPPTQPTPIQPGGGGGPGQQQAFGGMGIPGALNPPADLGNAPVPDGVGGSPMGAMPMGPGSPPMQGIPTSPFGKETAPSVPGGEFPRGEGGFGAGNITPFLGRAPRTGGK